MRLIIRWTAPSWHFRFPLGAALQDRLQCLVLGHDDDIVIAERSIALRCKRCGRCSPGWHLDPSV